MANSDRIVPLDQLSDYKVADGDPDVRGWGVVASDGRRIGKVDNLLVDTGAMKVRYLDVDLDREIIRDQTNKDRHVLVPIGRARLDDGKDEVLVDAISSTEVASLPPFTSGPVTPEYEGQLRERWGGEPKTGGPSTEMYDDANFYGSRRNERGESRVTLSEEELEIQRQQRQVGEVAIRKDVETRHVSENVPVSHEEVVVERRAAQPGTGSEPRIQEGEMHIPITEEELVVQKRAVPKEELVVKKVDVVEGETVEADLRRERAEVTEEGDVRRQRDRK